MVNENVTPYCRRVVTVRGLLNAEDLGKVSMHEHLLVDSSSFFAPNSSLDPISIQRLGDLRWNPFLLRDNLILDDMGLLERELNMFKDAGGRTIVEVTCRGLGKGSNPEGLSELARRTGLNIIASVGYYVHSSHPDEVADLTVDELSDLFTSHILNGIDGSDICAGVIGEIGTSAPITQREIKVLRSASRAHKRTGAPIIVHLDARGTCGMDAIRVFEDEGVNPSRIVLGHCDERIDLEYHLEMLRTGAALSFDTFGTEVIYSELGFAEPSDMQRMIGLVDLLNAGAKDQIVVGQDIFMKQLLTEFGGMGYAHILLRIVPALRDIFGVDEDTIQALLVRNPQRVLPLFI